MRKNKILPMSLAGIIGAVSSAGCYTERKLPEMSFQQASLRYEQENLRIGVEPIDSGGEAHQMFGYRLCDKDFLGVYVRSENNSQTQTLKVNRNEISFRDSTGHLWTQGTGGQAAAPFAAQEGMVAAAAIGATAGLLAPIICPLFQPLLIKDAQRKTDGVESKTMPETQELFPQGSSYGCVFFSPLTKIGSFEDRITGGTLTIPYVMTKEKADRFEKATFKFVQPSNYFERTKQK